MTQQIAEAGPTLLPYLENRDLGLRLKLAITGIDPKWAQASLPAIEASGPFAQIIEGFITADGHSSFSDVFALVQADTYLFSPSELSPITNIDVEQLWQQAWAAVCKGPEAKAFILPVQISANNSFLPLRSIFQCQFKQRYFHPLCPQCGQTLILCRDDQILHAAGLQGYSQSLERYLYCPACQMGSQEAAKFYTFHEPADAPPHLQGSCQLIEAFSRLLANEQLADDLPCVGCDEAKVCFGPQTVVHDRLKPLFFYPFFMLLQPAPKLNLLEFLELIAGAGYEQVAQNLTRKNKPGRLRQFQRLREPLSHGSGFLSDSGDHLFLEVLYLKLCLLDELMVLISQLGGEATEPVKSNSLEGVWVDLPEQSARFPLFWNFSLRLIDRIGRPSQTSFLAEAQKRYFCGLAWCYILLVDDNQDMDKVHAAVNNVIFDTKALEQLEMGLATQVDDAFAPQHLLRPTVNSLPPTWQALWGRAVCLGVELLRSGQESAPQWSDEFFYGSFNDLKKEIRKLLFSEPRQTIGIRDTQGAEAEDGEAADEADYVDGKIFSILNAILEDWPESASQIEQKVGEEALTLGTQPEDTRAFNDDGDVEETLILAQSAICEMIEPCFEEIPPEFAVLEKTVIISTAKPGDGDSDTENIVTPQSPVTENELEKTVVVTPDNAEDGKP